MASEAPNNGRTSFAAYSPTSTLSAELWLHILEQVSVHEAGHLWTTVRNVSRQFKDLVERLFRSTYLPTFAITLTLPRRDPTSGALLWPGAPIPRAQLSMLFDSLSADERYAQFRSPNVLREGTNERSVEELKDTYVLPLERLEAATAWVHFTRNQLAGMAMPVPRYISWDEEQNTWVWRVKWMNLMTRFYVLKKQNPSMQRQSFKSMIGQPKRLNGGV
jgi:hypothetical protein